MFGEKTDENGTEENKKRKEDAIRIRLNWLTVCINIAEVYNCKLNEVYELQITEFMNLVNYINWKNKEIEKKYKKS